MVGASQGVLENLVGDDGAGISEAEQRVISEDCLDPHCAGMEHSLVSQGRKRLYSHQTGISRDTTKTVLAMKLVSHIFNIEHI